MRPQSSIDSDTASFSGGTIFTLDAFAVAQGLLGGRSLLRMLLGAAGDPIAPESPGRSSSAGTVAAIVPVLDEATRLGPCLAALCASGPELAAIIVVDGGSRDGTPDLARGFAARDARVLVVDAAPVGAGWNGKAWGLSAGLERAATMDVSWVVTIDADVRPAPGLVASLAAHARKLGLRAFSAAPRQSIGDALQGVLHPSFLTSLVYRFGLPGNVATDPANVQANGQCFFADLQTLVASGAIERARSSPCEDVTIARTLVAAGIPVGFFEAGALAEVEMYESGAECWRNWPRSLPLRDADTPLVTTLVQLCELALVQALPLAMTAVLAARGKRRSLAFAINLGLAIARIGILAGTKRAYARVPATYWLSPLADLATVAAIVRSTFARTKTWRGRTLVRAERNAA